MAAKKKQRSVIPIIFLIAIVFSLSLTAILMLTLKTQRPPLKDLADKYKSDRYFITYNEETGLLMTLSSADKNNDFKESMEVFLSSVAAIDEELGMPSSVVEDIRDAMDKQENYKSGNKEYGDVVFHFNYMYEPYEKVEGNFEALTVVYKDK